MERAVQTNQDLADHEQLERLRRASSYSDESAETLSQLIPILRQGAGRIDRENTHISKVHAACQALESSVKTVRRVF